LIHLSVSISLNLSTGPDLFLSAPSLPGSSPPLHILSSLLHLIAHRRYSSPLSPAQRRPTFPIPATPYHHCSSSLPPPPPAFLSPAWAHLLDVGANQGGTAPICFLSPVTDES
jgi:hypothetical protein